MIKSRFFDFAVPQTERTWMLGREAENGRSEVVRALIDAGADVNAKASLNLGLFSGNPVLSALLSGDRGTLATILEAGGDICSHDALQYCKSAEMIQLCLDFGADATKPIGRQKRTPLMFVRDIPSAKLLIEYGADIKSRDLDGYDALCHAIRRSYGGYDCIDLLQFLIDNGAELNPANPEWPVPLFVAVSNIDFIKLLFNNGADIGLKFKGQSLLAHAFDEWDIDYDLVSFLLDNGADLHETCTNGSSFLKKAIDIGDIKLIKTLLHHGVEIEAGCLDEWGQGEIVELLMRFGAYNNTVVPSLQMLCVYWFKRHRCHLDNHIGDLMDLLDRMLLLDNSDDWDVIESDEEEAVERERERHPLQSVGKWRARVEWDEKVDEVLRGFQ